MRFKFCYILLFVFAGHSLKAQNFFRSYGNANDEFANAVVEGSDSSFYLFGSSSSYVNSTSNFYLLNIDSIGNFLWSKTYGGSGIEQGEAIDLKANGHLLLTGYSNSSSGNYDLVAIETDSAGNEVWFKYYGGNDWDFAYDITSLPTGEAIITGSTYSYGAGNQDGFLLMIDSNGDSLWMKTYGDANNNVLRKSIVSTDGEIISIGYTHSSNGDKDFYLVKTHPNGDTIWTKTYGTIEDDEGYSICESKTGNYLICGYTEGIGVGAKEGYYFETDTSGLMLWNQNYGGAGDDIFKSIAFKTNEDRIYIAWETNSFGNGQSELVINSFYRNGGWYNSGNSYGTSMSEGAGEVIYTKHKRVLAVGYTNFPYGNKDMMAVLTDTLFPTQSVMSNYIDVTAVQEFDLRQFNVYPNPAAGRISISTSYTVNKIEIFDMAGQIIISVSDTKTIDLSGLPPAIYLLNIHTEEGIEGTYRIAVTRQ